MGNSKKKRLAPVEIQDGKEILGGAPINELVLATCSSFELNPKTQQYVLTEGTLKLVADTDIALQYSADTLAVLLAYVQSLRETPQEQDIVIDIEEYARAGGYDISVKSQRDAFVKRLEKQRRILYNLTASWSIDKGEAAGDYEDVHLITAKGRRKNLYYVRFDTKLKDALLKQYYITPIHRKALLLRAGTKGKRPTRAEQLLPVMTYILTNRYNMTSNREKGTHDIIKIESIIKSLNLPTIEALQEKGSRKYREEIIQPIADTLNFMMDEGILKAWDYCKAKKQPMTDEEKEQIRSLINDGYITFTLTPPDTETA